MIITIYKMFVTHLQNLIKITKVSKASNYEP